MNGYPDMATKPVSVMRPTATSPWPNNETGIVTLTEIPAAIYCKLAGNFNVTQVPIPT